MRYVEIYRIGNISIEVSPVSHRNSRSNSLLTKLAQWGLGAFIKAQLGNLIGTLLNSFFPTFALSGALLIASILLYLALANPGFEALAPTVLGLAVRVLG